MAGEKNFNVKNGLSVAGTEVIQSDGTYVGSISATALNESVDDRVADLLQAGTGISLTYDDANNQLTIDGQQGDITGVTAGDGLTGGGNSGAVTLAVQVDDSSLELASDTVQVKAGGITNDMLAGSIVNGKLSNSSVSINSNSVSLGGSVTLDTGDFSENGNLFFTNERVDDRVNALIQGGTNVTTSYDDANGTLTINSSGKTQEEIEDIVNGLITGGVNVATSYDDAAGTLEIRVPYENIQDTVGAQLVTNGSHTGITASYDDAGDAAIDLAVSSSHVRGLFSAAGDLSYNSTTGAFSVTKFTTANARSSISAGGDLSYNSTTGVISYTEPTMYADSDARGAISVTDSGGDGSLAYNSSTGVITYTGPSASEVRAHLSAGTGVSYSGGAFSIGQAVATDSDVTFADVNASGNVVVTGNLTVNGSTVTNSATNTTIEDALIELGSGNSGANSNDLGLILERGSTGDNVFMGWDESSDRVRFATTTATGSSSGALTLTNANIQAGRLFGNVTGDVTGKADTADAWETARTITLGGDLSGSVSIDGSANATLTATVGSNAVALGSNTTGNYVSGISGTSNEISVSGSGSENATVTIGLPDDVTIGDALTVTGKGTTGFTTIGSSDGAFRNTFIHSSAPSSSDGQVGDVWITYS